MKINWYRINRSGGFGTEEGGNIRTVTLDDDEFEDEGNGGSGSSGSTTETNPNPATSTGNENPEPAPETGDFWSKWLQQQGFADGKTVVYGDQEVDFHSLPEADKFTILNQLTKPQLEGDAKIIVDLLESGTSVKDIARQLLAGDVDYSTMSEAEIHTLDIKREYGEDLTEEEIQAEIDRRKGSPLFARQTDKIRKQLMETAEKADLSSISAAERQRQQAEIDRDARELVAAAQKRKDFFGFEPTEEQLNFVLKDLVEVDDTMQSAFIRDLQDPDKLIEAAWAYKMIPGVVKYFQDELASVEARVRQELLEGMPGQPISGNRIEKPAPGAQPQPQAAPQPKSTAKPGEEVASRLGGGNSRPGTSDDDWEQTSLDD